MSPGLRKKVSFSFRRGLASVWPNSGAVLTPANWRELASIPCLKSLSDFDRLPAKQLAQVSLCPNIQALHKSGWQRARDLTEEDWEALTGLTRVERFSMSSLDDQLGDETARHLSLMPQLKAIELNSSTVTDAGVAHLANLTGLEVLRLPFGGEPEGVEITDVGVEAISSLRRLRELDLAGSRMTDAGLARLAALKHLTHLDIGRTSVRDPMPVVVRLKKLRYLGLERIHEIDDSDLKELAKRLPALRGLDLQRTSVTQFWLGQLLPKTKWKSIHLEARMGQSDEREVEAFKEFCRERDVFVEVEWE